jgi:hypothetical protein
LSAEPDPIAEAIARGGAVSRVLVEHRDALFPHLHMILRIAGEDGLRASAAGACEAVIIAARRDALGLPSVEDGEVLAFPPPRAGEGP